MVGGAAFPVSCQTHRPDIHGIVAMLLTLIPRSMVHSNFENESGRKSRDEHIGDSTFLLNTHQGIRGRSQLSTFTYYSRPPLIRPPSESHWCGRRPIRGMVAREGFVYEQKPLSVTRNVVV